MNFVKPTCCFLKFFSVLFFSSVLFGLAQGSEPSGVLKKPKNSSEPITLNFHDVEISLVVGAFAHLLDRPFMVDPRVRGKMTIETPTPVTKLQAYKLLQGMLRAQGFATIDTGEIVRVVPEADAKLQAATLRGNNLPSDDQVVTKIFHLKYELASNLLPVLRPLVSPNNTVTPYPAENVLVVTDYANNLARISKIIKELDKQSENEIEIIPLMHAVAEDVIIILRQMLAEEAKNGGNAAGAEAYQRIVLSADTRSNSVLIRSSDLTKMQLTKNLVAQLDRPNVTPNNVHVVYLRNAEAGKLSKTLAMTLGAGNISTNAREDSNRTGTQISMNTPGGSSSVGSSNYTGNTISGLSLSDSSSTTSSDESIRIAGATIAADGATNSLIITASEPVYRNLRGVIDKLDTRRAQVFIESLIVEVSAEKSLDLGIQWQQLKIEEGQTRMVGGTNFKSKSTNNSIIEASRNIAAGGEGLNLGLVKGSINVPGIGEVMNLGTLIRILSTDSQTNILATPNLLTLDNEEAKIVIGQNVPFITGQFSSSGTSVGGSINPFQTIERKDVGTSLRVKPQVSESGTIKLQIFQEVSNVDSTNLSAGIITNRRAIESNVLVDDGQIIVLGGLIQNQLIEDVQKVPILGDIPIIGNLFRYDSRKTAKTNLLVFLRPVIVRDGADAYGVTAPRYDYIRGVQRDSGIPSLLSNAPSVPPLGPMGPKPLHPSIEKNKNQKTKKDPSPSSREESKSTEEDLSQSQDEEEILLPDEKNIEEGIQK